MQLNTCNAVSFTTENLCLPFTKIKAKWGMQNRKQHMHRCVSHRSCSLPSCYDPKWVFSFRNNAVRLVCMQFAVYVLVGFLITEFHFRNVFMRHILTHKIYNLTHLWSSWSSFQHWSRTVYLPRSHKNTVKFKYKVYCLSGDLTRHWSKSA